MMGVQDPLRGKLCYTNFNLDKQIRPIIPCAKSTNSSTSTSSTKRWQTSIGSRVIFPPLRPSAPPPLILKLMLLYQDQLQRTGGIQANRDTSCRPRGVSSWSRFLSSGNSCGNS